MNVRLLRRIEKRILKEPGQFDMGDWLRRGLPKDKLHPCGTEACIAGWACILSKKVPRSYLHVQEVATKLLGISPYGAQCLFVPTFWPNKFGTVSASFNPGTKAYARNAVRRIEHFIKTKGAE